MAKKVRMAFQKLLQKNLVDMHRGRFLKTKDLFMLLRGEVEYNADPLMLGRLKVRVPQLHGVLGEKGSVPTEDLSWAYTLLPRSVKDSGSFMPPQVGEKVWVLFEAGRMDNIIVLGSWFSIPDEENKIFNPPVNIKLEKLDMIGKGDLEERSSCVVSRGTELIRECWDMRNLNPNRISLYKSVKGALFLIDDRDEEEAVTVIDRLGQFLSFEGAVSEENNLKNLFSRRNIEKENKIVSPIRKRITLQSDDNTIQLDSSDDVGIKIKTQHFTIILSSGDIKITNNDNLGSIILRNDGAIELNSNLVIYGNVDIFGNINVFGDIFGKEVVNQNMKLIGEKHGDNNINKGEF